MSVSKSAARSQLIKFYKRNGYVRIPDKKRRKKESRSYKMGYEIRFVANTKAELALMRKLLKAVGFKPGKPFGKTSRYCQPVYGKVAMEQFGEWVDLEK
jgi:hypothetical protein